MRTRFIFAWTLLLLLTPSASPSLAASLGIQIVVQQNSGAGFVTIGTALGGPAGASTPLFVNNNVVGNTLRFTIRFDQTANFNSYNVGIRTDDPTEIDFVNGSAKDLSGKGFAALGGNPNNSLNDATPASGAGNSAGSATVPGQDLFRVDYIVTGLFFDSLKDFTANLTGVGSGNVINTLKREASVSIRAVSVAVPEPLSLGLLLSGLAGLAGTGLLRRRS